jgi:chorismate-pyruvate lyase
MKVPAGEVITNETRRSFDQLILDRDEEQAKAENQMRHSKVYLRYVCIVLWVIAQSAGSCK